MRNFGFNGMDDEEFKRDFMRFLNMYQSGLDNFIKKNYLRSEEPFNKSIFFNFDPIDDDVLRNILKQKSDEMDIEKGSDEMGEWEKRSWQSPDGSSSFNSYSRNSFFNPFEGKVRFKEESDDVTTLRLLERKLNNSIQEERYEDAAKIRDLIKSFKKDSEK